MSHIVSKVSGIGLKDFIKSSKFCKVNSSGCFLEGRFGFVTFDFSGEKDVKKCQLRFKRLSGNGLLSITSGSQVSSHNIVSKVSETITIDLDNSSSMKILRPASGIGTIELLTVSLLSDAPTEINKGFDIRAELNKCAKKSVKITNNRVFVNEGSSIKHQNDIHVVTDPPNMFRKEEGNVEFLGLCEVKELIVDKPAPKPVSEGIEKIRNASSVLGKTPSSWKAPQVQAKRRAPNPHAKTAKPFRKEENKYIENIFEKNTNQSKDIPLVSSDDLWKLSKIPKIAHFYWGGNLPFLRYVSVYSFVKHNPDWKVKIHIPEITGNISPTWNTNEQSGSVRRSSTDSMNMLKELDVEFISHNFENYDLRNDMHEVHKSDFVRWMLLSTEGGVWSDFDIIYHKPMHLNPDNKPQNSNKDTGFCRYKTGDNWGDGSHAIGYLMSSPNNAYYRNLFQLSKRNFRANSYQVIGASLLNRKFASLKKSSKSCDLLGINPDSVYSLTNIPKFLSEDVSIDDYKDAIGFHWYGGSPDISKYENSVNKLNYKKFNHFLGKLVQRTLEGK